MDARRDVNTLVCTPGVPRRIGGVLCVLEQTKKFCIVTIKQRTVVKSQEAGHGIMLPPFPFFGVLRSNDLLVAWSVK